jgi:hypothetical protein
VPGCRGASPLSLSLSLSLDLYFCIRLLVATIIGIYICTPFSFYFLHFLSAFYRFIAYSCVYRATGGARRPIGCEPHSRRRSHASASHPPSSRPPWALSPPAVLVSAEKRAPRCRLYPRPRHFVMRAAAAGTGPPPPAEARMPLSAEPRRLLSPTRLAAAAAYCVCYTPLGVCARWPLAGYCAPTSVRAASMIIFL